MIHFSLIYEPINECVCYFHDILNPKRVKEEAVVFDRRVIVL